MSNWTPTAREALERYLEKSRANLVTVGGDPEEVVADLRRHVEEEVAELKLSVVTEQDVQRIIARLGGVPAPETPSAPKTEPAQPSAFKKVMKPVGSLSLLLFGVILPAGTLIFELVNHMAAEIYIDPISTWLHVLLLAVVPLVNLMAWLKIRQTKDFPWRWLWLGNGIALGITLFYAIVFLPITPIAAIGIMVYGIGFLPLAPLLSMICTLRFRVHLRRQLVAAEQPIPRGWGLSALLPILLLTLLAVPGPLTRYWINEAASESSSQSVRAIKLLRTFGSEEVMLKECYGVSWRRGGEFKLVTVRDSEAARNVFYRVTGKPFNSVPPPLGKYQRNGRALLDEFEWDEGLGGEAVAGQVRGLSMIASRMDGTCHPEEGWAYLEWIMEFRNDHEFDDREARAQIQLPPGGVVSRLTLWVNGEEREAAFAGRGEVREAYQKVAVEQRRDPVLVTTSGPDRVLMQCFPVPRKGGTMKIRVGVTVPLTMADREHSALRLPCFTERNFKLPKTFEHSVWMESSAPASSGIAKFKNDSSKAIKGIRGELVDAELSSPESTLWFDHPPFTGTYAKDSRSSDGAVIKQVVETVPFKVPSRIALVLDGSANMTKSFEQIAQALEGLPNEAELGIWLMQEGATNIFNSAAAAASRESPSAAVARQKGLGGQDNVPGLTAAYDWALGKPDGVVLWIHGPQPIVLSSVEPLAQRLDWTSGPDGARILDIPVVVGPNRVAEKLSTKTALQGIVRVGSLSDDLKRLFSSWKTGSHLRFVRTVEKPDDANAANGSSHIVRLWALDETGRLIKVRNVDAAVKLAATYQLVTTVSGAVVLETKQQYTDAGLTPVDPASVPVIPEPSTWLLLVVATGCLFGWRRFRSNVSVGRVP